MRVIGQSCVLGWKTWWASLHNGRTSPQFWIIRSIRMGFWPGWTVRSIGYWSWRCPNRDETSRSVDFWIFVGPLCSCRCSAEFILTIKTSSLLRSPKSKPRPVLNLRNNIFYCIIPFGSGKVVEAYSQISFQWSQNNSKWNACCGVPLHFSLRYLDTVWK